MDTDAIIEQLSAVASEFLDETTLVGAIVLSHADYDVKGQEFKEAISERLVEAAMLAKVDEFAIDLLVDSFRNMIQMRDKIRADDFTTYKKGIPHEHYLLNAYNSQQAKFYKYLSSVGGTPMSRHAKNMSTFVMLGGAQKVPHGNSKKANILDIINE